MVTIDIKIKMLPASHRIYMVRPGTGYHLLRPMYENGVVAPDLAFLDVPDGIRPRDHLGISTQITRSRAFAEWVKTEDRRAEDRPPEELPPYIGKEAPPRVAMYRNTADEILYTLPKGSLIFIPNPDLTKDGMFGELSAPDAPRVRFAGSAHRGHFQYLGRKLENVNYLPMRKLPPEFFEPMRRRNWTHEYGSRETELLYRQYYGDFELIGRKALTEIEVTGQRVSGTDLSIIGALTTLIDQTLMRLEAGDHELLRMVDAAFLPPDPNGPIVHANIGSPGELLVESVLRRAAPVLKVIFCLAIGYVAHDIWDMIQSGTLTLENSMGLEGAGDAQLADTRNKTFDFVRATGRENLNEIVGLVRDFNGRTGGEVDANIRVND
jgi:hypothetical protein